MTYTTIEIKEIAAAIASIVNTPVSTRMTFTVEELLEEKDYTYLTVSTCGGCRHEFPEFVPCDPGAEYHAFLVPTCPICIKALGGPLFDYDLDQDQRHLIYLAHEGNMGEGFFEDEDAYNEFLDGPEEQDDWNSDDEKWANYWGDYNQCGVHVSY